MQDTLRSFLLLPVPMLGVLAGLVFAGLLFLACRGKPAAKPIEEEVHDDEDEWPDAWDLWSWYATSRLAAHAHTENFDMSVDVTEQTSAPYRAALAIGSMEGARMRRSGDTLPLLTADELDAEITRILVGKNEAPAKPETAAVPADAPVVANAAS
jgi:hypothetical protein